jgi:ABC-type amino acid transport substrate-binding protein
MHENLAFADRFYRDSRFAVYLVLVITFQSIYAILSPQIALAQDIGQGTADTPSREIIAAVPEHWPPHYQVDKNGSPTGFAIDILDEVASRANLTVKYVVAENFLDAINLVELGEADLIPNIGILPERFEAFNFSPPVETFVVSLFVRSGGIQVRNTADLVGR